MDSHKRRHKRSRATVVPGDVLERALAQILERSEVPLGAYTLASDLRDIGHRVPVMSVYRALDRLIDREIVQKVETLSCYRIRDKADAVLLICTRCGSTQSLSMPAEYDRIVHGLPERGF
jgi:Fur family transcriptional regulator, zinc uptake regulator